MPPFTFQSFLSKESQQYIHKPITLPRSRAIGLATQSIKPPGPSPDGGGSNPPHTVRNTSLPGLWGFKSIYRATGREPRGWPTLGSVARNGHLWERPEYRLGSEGGSSPRKRIFGLMYIYTVLKMYFCFACP